MQNYLICEAMGNIAGILPTNIRFLESKDYDDCIKLAISLGCDADSLAAIAGSMAYAYYKKMPDALVFQTMKKLSDRMMVVSERFDQIVNDKPID